MATQKFTIATFNTLGFSYKAANIFWRYRTVTHYFKENLVDLLQLQEVFTYAHLGFLKRHLSTYPYVAYQKGWLGPKGGLVTFSRHPLTSTHYVHFEHKHTPSLGTFLFRVFGKGILITCVADTPLLCMNVHCHAVLNGDWSEKSNYYELLKDDLKNIQKTVEKEVQDHLVIISGDLNTAKDSSLYREICFSNKIHDSFRNDSDPTFHQEFLSKNDKPHCIDYLLLYTEKQSYTLIGQKRLFEKRIAARKARHFVSDHIGLQATIILSK